MAQRNLSLARSIASSGALKRREINLEASGMGRFLREPLALLAALCLYESMWGSVVETFC